MTDYPRDLVGYGRNPPHARWPNEARIAVQFVINYEEGGENNILHGDAASEAFLSEVAGATPWPGQRHMNMESMYEYGGRAGFWRLYRMFTERNMPLTVYAVATAMQRNPEPVAAMKEAGWEIASHGLKWIDYKDIDEATERSHIHEAVSIHTEVAGERPLGLYQGRTSENSVRLTAEEGGFLYSADSYADDLPYWTKGPKGPLLMTPYSLDANDMRFATSQGYHVDDGFFGYLKDSFDYLYAEGESAPKMLSIGLHCRLVGRPGRAASLARFLDYVARHEHVWVARRIDIARHWIKHHPPTGGYVPSQMSAALFHEVFGDIFEHTPKIARNAHAKGLTSAQDTSGGLHAAMVAAMHAMSREDKLALINAHPDLAGRLALAKQLTDDSTKEQGSAGLDRLTPQELNTFTTLNDAYKARFSFPFIMAVKGATKEQILENFQRRVKHDYETEFEEALKQIERITFLRLSDRLPA